MGVALDLVGTSEATFFVGSVGKHQIFDASGLTATRTWVLPDGYGTSGDVLSNDGTGVLSWQAVGSASDQTTPYYIPSASSFTVNTNKQNLFNLPIVIEGSMTINGALVQV